MTKYHLAPVRDGRADWDNAVLPPLSRRQLHILAVIRIYTLAMGYPPSLAEIGAAVGLRQPSAVLYHVRQLRDRGYVRRDTTKARALVLAEPRVVQDSQLKVIPGGGA
ncbi:hypothetical protein ACIBTV_26710 [Micromonospora sp. NPDC049366]|uniref:LexA family protein n=1 Tax=Micromonospora sp. NPDC049366 TaxID=3364271 RepID=UPI00378F438F